MNRLELLYSYQKTESGLKVYADMHHVNQNTMTRWIRQFLLHGLAGVRHRSFNQSVSQSIGSVTLTFCEFFLCFFVFVDVALLCCCLSVPCVDVVCVVCARDEWVNEWCHLHDF